MCGIPKDKFYQNMESFIESAIYKNKFTELYENGKIFHIMVCNNLVLRIARITSHYKTYLYIRNLRTKIPSCQLPDFIIVEEIVYHIRKAIDEMIYFLWMNRIGISNIDDQKYKAIDSIGKYLKQKDKAIDEFDEYLDFLNKINILSNSYKHSINTFSPVETDLHCENEKTFWITYAVKESDYNEFLLHEDALKTLDKMFNKFLLSI